jgi:hypothetical protein
MTRPMAARIPNEARLLQFESSLSDSLAAHTEHVRDQFLSHHKFVALQTIQAQEQPAT